MLPAEMGKVATMLGTEPSALQSLATADETKIKLPVTLEVPVVLSVLQVPSTVVLSVLQVPSRYQ